LKKIFLFAFAFFLCQLSFAQIESDDEYEEDETELNDSLVVDSASLEDIQLDNYLEDFLHEIGYYFETANVPTME